MPSRSHVAAGDLGQAGSAATQFLAVEHAVAVAIQPLEHDLENRTQLLRHFVLLDPSVTVGVQLKQQVTHGVGLWRIVPTPLASIGLSGRLGTSDARNSSRERALVVIRVGPAKQPLEQWTVFRVTSSA